MLKKNRGKRRALMLLALMLCACLAAGCGGAGTKDGSPGKPAPVEIVVESLTFGQEMPDLGAVEAAVSAVTLPALNCTVKLKTVPIASQKSALRLMRARNERIDLVNTGRTDALTDMVSDGLLIPLDGLLESHGSALLDAYGALLDACRVNGRIYAVPAQSYVEDSSGFVYNAQMAQSAGVALSEAPDFDELEAAAELLRGQGKYLTLPETNGESSRLFTALYPDLQPVSGNLCHGVLTGGDGAMRVVSPYATGEFMDYCLRMRRWVEQGWMPDDFLLSGLNGADEFRKGSVFMKWIGVNPVEMALESRNYPFPVGMFATGRSGLATRTVQENGWGISSTCRDPEAAMALLNFIHENAEVANLLMNGLEGREYRRVSEHIIALPEGESAATLKYARIFTLFGDYRNVYEWEPMTEDDVAALRAYYAAEPSLSPLFGYSFDVTPVSGEATAVYETLANYLPALECGLVEDVPAAVEVLNQKLRQAGIERILEENQRQLEAWLEEKRRS